MKKSVKMEEVFLYGSYINRELHRKIKLTNLRILLSVILCLFITTFKMFQAKD